MATKNKIKNVTTYGLVAGIYFRAIIRAIIRIGDLSSGRRRVLDFGCGHGVLKEMLGKPDYVINYDIVPELSDVADWRDVDFEIIVANEVFYSFSEDSLCNLLENLKDKNPKMKLIIGVSRQSMLNNIGKMFLGYSDAHDATVLGPEKEMEIIKRFVNIKKSMAVFFLMDLHLCEFRDKESGGRL